MEYNFREIEKKWQQRWVENHTYQVTEDERQKEILRIKHVPLSIGSRLTRRTPARIHC